MQLCLQTKLIRELFKNMCSFHLIYKFCRFTLMFELTDLLCVKHLTFIWNSADCLNANLIFVRVNACSFIWRSGSDWAQRNYILQKAMCILRLGDILTLVKLYINNSRFYQKQRKKKIISRRRERCRGASEAWWCSDSTWCKPTSRTSGDILFSLIWPIEVIPKKLLYYFRLLQVVERAQNTLHVPFHYLELRGLISS